MLQIMNEMRKGQGKGTIISINLLSTKSIFLFPLWHLFEETLQNSIWIQANAKKGESFITFALRAAILAAK